MPLLPMQELGSHLFWLTESLTGELLLTSFQPCRHFPSRALNSHAQLAVVGTAVS